MEMEIRLGSRNERGKKSLIAKALERCRSLTPRRTSSAAVASSVRKSMPWRRSKSAPAGGKHHRAPGGCFTVHVGPNKERFVIKTECVNHPLFKMLLDEAETAYGFAIPGPLELPCDVDLFYKVLCEMDQEMVAPPRCGGFAKSYGACGGRYWLISPSRLVVAGHV